VRAAASDSGAAVTVLPYRLAGVLSIGFVLLVGCADESPDWSRQDRPLVALLSDGELVNGTIARLGEGVRLTEGTLRPLSGRLIAVTPDRRLVAVLLATTRSREVVVLTARDLPITARVQLPVDDTTSATTLVAPVNDRLVVLGARETQKGGHLPVGWVIELPRGDVAGRWSIQKPPRGNWTLFDAAAAPDAKRLYLSYHGTCNGGPGACTTGVDVVAWKSGRPLCRARPNSLAGCIAAMHGEVALIAGGVLGTRGDDQSVLLADEQARVADRRSTRLAGNHLMRLAYDAANRGASRSGPACTWAAWPGST
jgi:hypothetical protein